MSGGEGAVSDIGCKEVAPKRGRAPDRSEPSEQGKQSVYCQLAVKKGTRVPGIGDVKNGFIAIVVLDSLEFSCNRVQGLVPGYTLEFPFPSLSCPLQGILEAVRGIHPLPIGTSTRTCPELGSLTVVGFNSGNHPVFNMYPEDTPAPTIVGTTG